MSEKLCPRCSKSLPLEQFYKYRPDKPHRKPRCSPCCKECERAKAAIKRAENGERGREYPDKQPNRTQRRAYETKGSEVMSEKFCPRCSKSLPLEQFYKYRPDQPHYAPRYSSYCKECERAKAAIKRAENRERGREYGRKYYAKNKQVILSRQIAYYHKHKDERRDLNRQRCREYARKNPEKQAARAHKRRALVLEAGGEFTSTHLGNLYRKQGGCCYYCGVNFRATEYRRGVVEHFIPLAKGGTNQPENIVLSCWACNSKKHAKMPWEFMPERFTPAELTPP